MQSEPQTLDFCAQQGLVQFEPIEQFCLLFAQTVFPHLLLNLAIDYYLIFFLINNMNSMHWTQLNILLLRFIGHLLKLKMAEEIALWFLKASIISFAEAGPTFVFSKFNSTCFILLFDLIA